MPETDTPKVDIEGGLLDPEGRHFGEPVPGLTPGSDEEQIAGQAFAIDTGESCDPDPDPAST